MDMLGGKWILALVVDASVVVVVANANGRRGIPTAVGRGHVSGIYMAWLLLRRDVRMSMIRYSGSKEHLR